MPSARAIPGAWGAGADRFDGGLRQVSVGGGAADAEGGGEFGDGFAGGGQAAQLILALGAEFGGFGGRHTAGAAGVA